MSNTSVSLKLVDDVDSSLALVVADGDGGGICKPVAVVGVQKFDGDEPIERLPPGC